MDDIPNGLRGMSNNIKFSEEHFNASYMLFAGATYYPDGGMDDFRGCGSIDDLKELCRNNIEKWTHGYIDGWAQIVDRETFDVVLIARIEDIDSIEWMKPGKNKNTDGEPINSFHDIY